MLTYKQSFCSVREYFQNSAETAAQLDPLDGWFRTGDIVELSADRTHVRVIDRRKNFFKLSVGEFVAPARLEALFTDCALVHQICVLGDSAHPHLIAVVVPTAALRSVSADTAAAHALHDRLLTELQHIAGRHSLKSCEVPRALLITNEPWTFENGLLTPTLKLNHHRIRQHHAAALDALFTQLEHQSERQPLSSAHAHAQVSAGDALLASIRELLRRDQVDMERSLIENGADSMACVRLLLRLPASASITAAELLRLSVQDLLARCDGPALAGNGDDMQRARIEADLALDPLASLSHSSPANGATAIDILVTGSSGFLGVHLVHALLTASPTAHVFCLVRAGDHLDATHKQHTAMQTHQLWEAHFSSRLTVLAGDAAAAQLGLAESDYTTIQSRIARVFHSAAKTNFVNDYMGSHDNVLSIMEVVRFVASTAPPKQLIHISTLSVFGVRLTCGESLHEEDENADFAYAFSLSYFCFYLHSLIHFSYNSAVAGGDGYSMSKWMAEQVLFAAAKRYPQYLR